MLVASAFVGVWEVWNTGFQNQGSILSKLKDPMVGPDCPLSFPKLFEHWFHLGYAANTYQLTGQPVGIQQVLEPSANLDDWKLLKFPRPKIYIIYTHRAWIPFFSKKLVETNFSISCADACKNTHGLTSLRVGSYLCLRKLHQMLAMGLGGLSGDPHWWTNMWETASIYLSCWHASSDADQCWIQLTFVYNSIEITLSIYIRGRSLGSHNSQDTTTSKHPFVFSPSAFADILLSHRPGLIGPPPNNIHIVGWQGNRFSIQCPLTTTTFSVSTSHVFVEFWYQCRFQHMHQINRIWSGYEPHSREFFFLNVKSISRRWVSCDANFENTKSDTHFFPELDHLFLAIL